MRLGLQAAGIMLLLVQLGACGQKGDLYREPEAAAQAVPAGEPAKSDAVDTTTDTPTD